MKAIAAVLDVLGEDVVERRIEFFPARPDQWDRVGVVEDPWWAVQLAVQAARERRHLRRSAWLGGPHRPRSSPIAQAPTRHRRCPRVRPCGTPRSARLTHRCACSALTTRRPPVRSAQQEEARVAAHRPAPLSDRISGGDPRGLAFSDRTVVFGGRRADGLLRLLKGAEFAGEEDERVSSIGEMCRSSTRPTTIQ